MSACDEFEALRMAEIAHRVSEPRPGRLQRGVVGYFAGALAQAQGCGRAAVLGDTDWDYVLELAGELIDGVMRCDVEARVYSDSHDHSVSDRGATWVECRWPQTALAEPRAGSAEIEVVACVHRTHEKIDTRFEVFSASVVLTSDGFINWLTPAVWTAEAKPWVDHAADKYGIGLAGAGAVALERPEPEGAAGVEPVEGLGVEL